MTRVVIISTIEETAVKRDFFNRTFHAGMFDFKTVSSITVRPDIEGTLCTKRLDT